MCEIPLLFSYTRLNFGWCKQEYFTVIRTCYMLTLMFQAYYYMYLRCLHVFHVVFEHVYMLVYIIC